MNDKPAIIVTGCSSGIGAYCAHALKADGWRVFATVRKPEDGVLLEAGGIKALIMDYTDTASIHAVVSAVLEQTGGRLDALFNNGAYGQAGAVEDLPTDVLRAQFEANFFGWHELTRLVIPVMRGRHHGRIVQCSSILGLIPYRWRGAYNASKSALEALTLTMAMEMRGSGLHVSLIEPGHIRSRFAANKLYHFEKNIDLTGSVHSQDYQRQLARMRGQTKDAKDTVGPEAVYRVLAHALTAQNPKPHYLVTRPAKAGALMKRLLPASLFYRFLSRFD